MLGSIIGAGISAASSLFGGKSAAKSAKKQSELEYQRQKEFATKGIQWKVQDAKSAGVHPLYALGAGTTSYAPQQVGGSDNGIGAAGQELGRAISANTGVSGRNGAFVRATQQLSLQRMELENQLLGSKIAQANQTMQPPAAEGETFMLDGQSNSGVVKAIPMKKEKGLPGKEYQEPAPITDYGYTKTKDGYAIVQSHDAKDRLEEDMLGSAQWNIRNRVIPFFTKPKPPYQAPPMHKWRYNPFTGEYRLVKPKFRRYPKKRTFNRRWSID